MKNEPEPPQAHEDWDSITADPSDPAGIDAPVIEDTEWREVTSIDADDRYEEIPFRTCIKPNLRGTVIA